MPLAAFKTSFRITWADTDAAQVVHYSNYFRFFERAEEEFYRHLGFSFTDINKMGIWLPRVESFCQFKKPARFGDLIEVELTVRELKEKSIKYEFKIFNKESAVLLANGYVVIVAADKHMERAVQIPKEIVEKLKPFCK
ncbi:MAG: acyl-CoA thioesterase [Candidatus Bathyarchaeota archaeon]|nr:acyl-CoA thioesterase [Candidatus Bathyarchaeota archaeon]